MTPIAFDRVSISHTVLELYNVEGTGGNLPPPPLPVSVAKKQLLARGLRIDYASEFSFGIMWAEALQVR